MADYWEIPTFASAGQRDWVVVTHDARIRYKPNELAAVVRHRVAMRVAGMQVDPNLGSLQKTDCKVR